MAAQAPGRAPIDWTGIVVTALGLGFFSILFAPETQSLSLVALPVVLALVIAGRRATIGRPASTSSPNSTP